MADNLQNPFDQEDSSINTSAFGDASMQPIDAEASGGTVAWFLLGIAALGCGLFFAVAILFFRPNLQAAYNEYFPSPTVTSSPTFTPSPTATPTPTQTPTPTPNMTAQAYEATAIAIPAADDAWQVIIADTFENNDEQWYTGTDDSEYTKITFAVEDGVYRWEALAYQGFVQRVSATDTALGDFYLAVDVAQPQPSELANYGLYFRETEAGDYYYFSIDDSGQYNFWLYQNGEWLELIPDVYTDAIRPGEMNQIAVLAEGSRFIFFINGAYIMEYEDTSIPQGAAGMIIELSEADASTVIDFDNLILKEPR